MLPQVGVVGRNRTLALPWHSRGATKPTAHVLDRSIGKGHRQRHARIAPLGPRTGHSLVEFNDGSVLAQLSPPDMRLPLQYCLTWPDRMPSLTRTLDLAGVGRLDFHAVNHNHFPCLRLAYRALAAGQAATCALNAANQVAVEAFIAGRIAFGDIPKVITPVLTRLSDSRRPSKPGISALLRVESWALEQAADAVASIEDRPLRRKE